jgi:branched-chain amino acid transport system permease protein
MFGNWPFLGGREGYSGIKEMSIFGIALDTDRRFYLLALSGLFVCYFVARRVRNSYAGRAMQAVGHDEVAAATLGINAGFHKMLSLALSSGIAGLAGSVSVATVLFVSPNSYDLVSSFLIAVWVIVAGSTSVTSAAVVAGLLTFATERSRGFAHYRVGLLGLLLIFVLFFRASVFKSWFRSIRNSMLRA